MPNHEHTHEGSAPHDHEGATPGHTHDAAAAAPPPPVTTTAAVDVGPTAGGLSARIILTLLGAAAMIVGVFLPWLSGGAAGIDTKATVIEINGLWSTEVSGQASFLMSVGALVILWGLLALLGLATSTGWLTRLAGALGLITVVLFAITMFRAGGGFSNIGLGMWISLIGSVLVLVAGFLGSRRVVSTTVPAA